MICEPISVGNGLDRSEHTAYVNEKDGMVKTIPYDGGEENTRIGSSEIP